MDLSNLLKLIEYVIYLTPEGGSVKFLFLPFNPLLVGKVWQ